MTTFIVYAAAALVAATAHELAHVAAALITGIPVRRIGLCWQGVYIVRACSRGWREVLTCAAGPLANIALAVILAGVSREFVLANAVFAAANLLPIENSDGTHILTAFKREAV